ncbi:MAG TPA: tRNA pseudouridine(38-40) synthase TruA [Chromatiaceae bacterium]|nr:tRNA pseudouridine(38-40) synthase TruA [Chromatiaceae bacterium]
MRIALGVEYDGSRFCGFQSQKSGVRTVQESLEQALSSVADHKVQVIAAGRTDTGVHANAQVVHFDTEALRPTHGWVMGSNIKLPADISVLWAQEVPKDFHARFSAQARTYRYFILNRKSRPAILSSRVTWVHRPLDAVHMQQAGQVLVGKHDFTSYRTVHCQAKSPVRTLHSLKVMRHGDFVVMEVYADGFLHHMVRNIAGVLIAIGSGDRPVDWAAEVLEHRDRRQGGMTAAPDGLYFHQVDYDLRYGIPVNAQEAGLLML